MALIQWRRLFEGGAYLKIGGDKEIFLLILQYIFFTFLSQMQHLFQGVAYSGVALIQVNMVCHLLTRLEYLLITSILLVP